MRMFKTKSFDRFTKKQNIGDEILRVAVENAELGVNVDVLGSDLYKSRIYMDSKGNRKGIRVLFAFKSAFRTLFVVGFEKSRKENLSVLEFKSCKELAYRFFDYRDSELDSLVSNDQLKEIGK